MRTLEFILAATLSEITPGPNMGYLAALAIARGRRAGLASVAGIALGLSALGVITALGFGVLVDTVPQARSWLRLAGIAYLFWLAVDTWRGEDGRGEELGQSFRRGLIVNLLNPKAAVFYVAVLPLFLGTPAPLADTLVLTVLFVVIATAVHAGVVIGAASFRRLARDEARVTKIRRGAALCLGLVALWFAWDTR